MITLYSGLVVRQPLVETIIPAFAEATGVQVETTFAPTTVLRAKIDEGDRPDLVLGVTAAVRQPVSYTHLTLPTSDLV